MTEFNDGHFGVATIIANGNQSSISNNATTLAVGDIGTDGYDSNAICIGYNGDNYDELAKIDLLEVCIFSRALSNKERNMLTAYFQKKYDF